MLIVCLAVPAVAQEAASLLFRVFLTDGRVLTAYGEWARVDDRVVFSMPLRRGDDHLRLERHVLHLRRRETLDRGGEARQSAVRIGLVGGDALLELGDDRMSVVVLLLELVERRVELVRARPQLAEQVRVLLRMMQLLGEGDDVMDHRPEQRKRRRCAAFACTADDEFEAVDDRGDRAVLVADDGERCPRRRR